MASGEETAGAVADYQCCTFRGSLVALDAATGRANLENLHDAKRRRPTTKNRIGTQLWGPPAPRSGRARRSTRSGTPSTSRPATTTAARPATTQRRLRRVRSWTSGKILWSRQMTARDDWNTSCRLPDQINCTEQGGAGPRFCLSANSRHAAERPSRARGRAEVGRRPRGRSRSRGTDPVAGARRPGRHQRRRAVGLGGRCRPMSMWRCRTSVAFPFPTAWPRCPIRSRRRDVRVAARHR